MGLKGFMSIAIMRNSSLFYIYYQWDCFIKPTVVHACFSKSAQQANLEEKAMLVRLPHGAMHNMHKQ